MAKRQGTSEDKNLAFILNKEHGYNVSRIARFMKWGVTTTRTWIKDIEYKKKIENLEFELEKIRDIVPEKINELLKLEEEEIYLKNTEEIARGIYHSVEQGELSELKSEHIMMLEERENILEGRVSIYNHLQNEGELNDREKNLLDEAEQELQEIDSLDLV